MSTSLFAARLVEMMGNVSGEGSVSPVPCRVAKSMTQSVGVTELHGPTPGIGVTGRQTLGPVSEVRLAKIHIAAIMVNPAKRVLEKSGAHVLLGTSCKTTGIPDQRLLITSLHRTPL